MIKKFKPPTLRKTPEAKNMMELIQIPSQLYPNKDCFRYRIGKENHSISYKQFNTLVENLSAGFIKMGLENTHIALIGEKCVEWIASYFAVINVGSVVVPLDKELAGDQVINFLDFADCVAVIYTKNYDELFSQNANKLSAIKHFIKISNNIACNEYLSNPVFTDNRFNLFENSLYTGALLSKNDADIEKMSVIIFTSGTTGTAKGVMLSQKNIVFCVNRALKFVDISSDDVLLSVLPFHHTYEMTAGILGGLFCGCTICINNKITSILKDMAYYKPTMLALVPLVVSTINKRIIETAKKQNKYKALENGKKISNTLLHLNIDIRKKIFSSVLQAFGGNLKVIVCGGAPLSPELVINFEALGISLKQGYGITECAPVVSLIPYDCFNPSSCGIPLPGIQVIIDRESEKDECGEILVKGDNVMLGYYKNPTATDEILSNRGWFATGDLGYMDKNGFLYITGRKKNVIVLENGKNVIPEEIEEYLEKIPLISDCIITSRLSDDSTQKITAIIYPDYEKAKEEGLADDESLKEHFLSHITSLNKNLSSYKQIRNIEVRKTPFHKTSTHKIQRHKIEKENDN